MEEVWKDVVGYEGLYQISNLGNIKSYHKRNKRQTMKPAIKRGYYQVGLRKNGTRKFKQVHRLVAQAFIPNKNNLPQVNHKDENKLNNVVDNLEWCTAAYNNCFGTRLDRVATKNKLKKAVILYDTKGKFIAEFLSISEASRKTNICTSCIIHSCKNKISKPRKYIWRYKGDD